MQINLVHFEYIKYNGVDLCTRFVYKLFTNHLHIFVRAATLHKKKSGERNARVVECRSHQACTWILVNGISTLFVFTLERQINNLSFNNVSD